MVDVHEEELTNLYTWVRETFFTLPTLLLFSVRHPFGALHAKAFAVLALFTRGSLWNGEQKIQSCCHKMHVAESWHDEYLRHACQTSHPSLTEARCCAWFAQPHSICCISAFILAGTHQHEGIAYPMYNKAARQGQALQNHLSLWPCHLERCIMPFHWHWLCRCV